MNEHNYDFKEFQIAILESVFSEDSMKISIFCSAQIELMENRW